MARILLVEDDNDIRELTALRLQFDGHHVFTAGDAVNAIELATGGQKFDVVVLDGDLPGADVQALAEEIRALEQTEDVPVVFYAAYGPGMINVQALSLPKTDPTRGHALLRLLATITSLSKPAGIPTA